MVGLMDSKPRKPRSIDGFIPNNRLNKKPLDRKVFARPAPRPSAPRAPMTTGLHQQPLNPASKTPVLTELKPKAKKKHWWSRAKKTDKKTRTRKQIIMRRSAIAGCIVLLIGGLYGWRLLANLNKAFHGNIFSDAKALVSTHKLKGEDQGRVNILLAGD